MAFRSGQRKSWLSIEPVRCGHSTYHDLRSQNSRLSLSSQNRHVLHFTCLSGCNRVDRDMTGEKTRDAPRNGEFIVNRRMCFHEVSGKPLAIADTQGFRVFTGRAREESRLIATDSYQQRRQPPVVFSLIYSVILLAFLGRLQITGFCCSPSRLSRN